MIKIKNKLWNNLHDDVWGRRERVAVLKNIHEAVVGVARIYLLCCMAIVVLDLHTILRFVAVCSAFLPEVLALAFFLLVMRVLNLIFKSQTI